MRSTSIHVPRSNVINMLSQDTQVNSPQHIVLPTYRRGLAVEVQPGRYALVKL